ncbi:hypothetical protein [Streptomyces yaizuensis]|uniref:Uncharacterized protein n=1 Tax=Streptomyces yaizuensis TaxID=2989713 RepID=A0AA86M9F3_9ACTN|nr:hypothetical protein [Streptomyces sp. YSPA8]BDT39580.1 hypothetical protein SYYSPA8_37310 [Streptomyces sp. YSPA8]
MTDEFMNALRTRIYTWTPGSLQSLTRAAARMTADFQRDHHPYTGGSMSPEAAERGRLIAREYGLKALDIAADLPDTNGDLTPSGLPTADTATTFLNNQASTRLLTRERVGVLLEEGFPQLLGSQVTYLLDWLTLGGYLLELRIDPDTGAVKSVRCGGKPTGFDLALPREPRWIGAFLGVAHSPLANPLRGVATVYGLHDTVANSFVR